MWLSRMTAVVVLSSMLPVYPVVAGGLFGDIVETVCGNCGAGKALDEAHKQVKEAVPPYKAVEEGATHVVKELTTETLAPLLAAAIKASRDDARSAGTEPIPPNIRVAMTKFYSDALLDRVRYRVGQGNELSVQANSIRFGDAAAVSLIDTIVFAETDDALYDEALWAHELHHIVQYADWGLMDFSKRYVRSSGSVENQAEAAADRYVSYWNQTNFRVTNNCDIEVMVALHFLGDDDVWRSDAWFSFDPGESDTIYSDEFALRSTNLIYYFYAKSPDGNHQWKGDTSLKLPDGQTVPMRKKQQEKLNGHHINLTCDD
jgi:uncharacterized membrane protein